MGVRHACSRWYLLLSCESRQLETGCSIPQGRTKREIVGQPAWVPLGTVSAAETPDFPTRSGHCPHRPYHPGPGGPPEQGQSPALPGAGVLWWTPCGGLAVVTRMHKEEMQATASYTLEKEAVPLVWMGNAME